MTPREYLQIASKQYGIIETARTKIQAAKEQADNCPIPENIRVATSDDILQGVILWYLDFENEKKWIIVDEVLRPEDNWKAFCGDDGCRYGLDGAYVEVN